MVSWVWVPFKLYEKRVQSHGKVDLSQKPYKYMRSRRERRKILYERCSMPILVHRSLDPCLQKEMFRKILPLRSKFFEFPAIYLLKLYWMIQNGSSSIKIEIQSSNPLKINAKNPLKQHNHLIVKFSKQFHHYLCHENAFLPR